MTVAPVYSFLSVRVVRVKFEISFGDEGWSGGGVFCIGWKITLTTLTTLTDIFHFYRFSYSLFLIL